MFASCSELKTIKCTVAFRQWCWDNQDTIALPNALRKDGTGTWQDALAASPAVAGLMQLNALRSTMQVSTMELDGAKLSAKASAARASAMKEIARLEETVPVSVDDEGRMFLTLEDDRTLELDEDGFPLGWFEDTAEVGSGTWELVD